MQVETHCELVTVRGHQLALRRGEQVLALEPASVGREHEYALVDHIENVGVTVMRGAQDRGGALLLARGGYMARTRDHGRAVEHAPDGTCSAKSARLGVVGVNGGVRGRGERGLARAFVTR